MNFSADVGVLPVYGGLPVRVKQHVKIFSKCRNGIVIKINVTQDPGIKTAGISQVIA